MDKLKDYIHNTIVTSGYSLSYVDFEEHHLNKLIVLCNEAKREIHSSGVLFSENELKDLLTELTHIKDSTVLDWDEKYDMCWKVKFKMEEYTSFDYYDPDGSYEADFMAFYNAAKDKIVGV